jgi:ribosome-binding protein aMBF1 (putative translation factor)
MKTLKKKTSDALKIMDQMGSKIPDYRQKVEEEVANLEVASRIHKLRTEAGLSQQELAERIGTTQSVISRLEDADYEGHSLAMLNRIAAAMKRRVEIHFVPLKRGLQAA